MTLDVEIAGHKFYFDHPIESSTSQVGVQSAMKAAYGDFLDALPLSKGSPALNKYAAALLPLGEDELTPSDVIDKLLGTGLSVLDIVDALYGLHVDIGEPMADTITAAMADAKQMIERANASTVGGTCSDRTR